MPAELSLYGHLKELRRRIIVAAIPFLAVMPLLFVKSGALLQILLGGLEFSGQYYVFSLTEPLLVRLKVALGFSLLLLCPWLAIQSAIFIFPGLYQRERISIGMLCLVFTGIFVLTLWMCRVQAWDMLLVFLNSMVDFGHEQMLSVSAVVGFLFNLVVWLSLALLFGLLICIVMAYKIIRIVKGGLF